MKLFKGKLVDSYGTGGSRKVFGPDALWKEEGFRSFIKEYPVILSTTHSLRYCAAKDYLFDYVLIDEASQVDIVTGSLALSVAKNAVIVGDLKQLTNVVDGGTRRVTADIYQSYELGEAYDYGKHSLLSSFNALYKDISKTLLKEHYRCHPKIIEFCNQKFYDNELIVLTEGGGDEEDVAEAGSGVGVVAAKGKPLILYKTLKGNHARGKFNQRQIDVVFQEIIPNERINVAKKSVGVVTPFRLQADKLQEVIGEKRIEADTVHKDQGRERDIIILTTVANAVGQNDFVDDPNLVNVAVSRAVDQLIVVAAEGSENWKGTNLGDLVRYIKYNNFEVMESEIRSVFDLLYKGYSERLLEVMKGKRKVSQFDSENLMNVVVERVLGADEFRELDYVMHQPLRMLIKDAGKLTDEERKFAMNILTHTDFMIFRKVDKTPVLVVEVDGHAFHAGNVWQLERDKMKDEILRKYGMPVLRLATTGSGEEERLRGELYFLIN